ncbi:MAG: formylglycine-generating enzyme family protein [Tenuifilaceae bacterium]
MKSIKISFCILVAILATELVFSQKPPKNFVLVPAGVISVDSSKLNVNAFYISKFEVSNANYRLFLNDLKAQGKVDDYKIAIIDSLQWRTPEAYNEPYVKHYHTHKAYDNYPVVNITHQAAILYCNWLTEKFNEEQKKKGLPLGNFKLPNINEWIWAARGGIKDAEYSWGSPYLRDEKGSMNCCYKRIGDEFITFNKISKSLEIVSVKGLKGFDNVRMMQGIPCPTESFKPNSYGIFNMCGGIAEFVIEPGKILGGSWNSPGYDVRIKPTSEYEGQKGPSIYIGFRPIFVYQENK